MTTNIDRAADLIADATIPPGTSIRWGMDRAVLAAKLLADAGLLAPDLPEPNYVNKSGLRCWDRGLYTVAAQGSAVQINSGGVCDLVLDGITDSEIAQLVSILMTHAIHGPRKKENDHVDD